jgi:hypothetical protein
VIVGSGKRGREAKIKKSAPFQQPKKGSGYIKNIAEKMGEKMWLRAWE